MTDACSALNAWQVCLPAGGVRSPGLESTLLNGGSFYDYYPHRDGRWMAVGSPGAAISSTCCGRLWRPSWRAYGLSATKEHRQRLKNGFERGPFYSGFCPLVRGVCGSWMPCGPSRCSRYRKQLDIRSWRPRGFGAVRAGGRRSKPQIALPIRIW